MSMKILGKGHHAIVLAVDERTASKLYESEKEAIEEEASLNFLEKITSEGLSIGCVIPRSFGAMSQTRRTIYTNIAGSIATLNLLPRVWSKTSLCLVKSAGGISDQEPGGWPGQHGMGR